MLSTCCMAGILADTMGLSSHKHLSSSSLICSRLFNFGIGIHLLQSDDPESMKSKTEINPKDNHISFQCESMTAMEEGGIFVDQLFFHDPDGFMVEICNCDNLPASPLGMGESTGACKMRKNFVQQQPKQQMQQQSIKV